MPIQFLLTSKLFKNCPAQEEALCLRALREYAASGFSSGAHLEKLHGPHAYFSIRVNDKARLLLVRNSNQADSFYVVRALINHEYEQA